MAKKKNSFNTSFLIEIYLLEDKTLLDILKG